MKEHKKNNLISATMVYTICNLFVSGLAVLTSPIFTRILSTGDYGIYSLFNSWQNIFVCITSLGLSYSIALAKIDYKEQFKQFIASILLISILIPILLLISSLVFGNSMWTRITELPSRVVTILFVNLIFYTVLDIARNKMSIQYEYKSYTIMAALRAVLSTGLSIILILVMSKSKYYGRINGVVIVTAIIGTFICIKYLKYLQWNRIIEHMKYALPIALPMIFHGLAMILLGQIDRVMIAKYYTESETGLYSFGYTVGTMLAFFTNAVSLAIKPWLYDKYAGGFHEEIRIRLKSILNMLIFVVLLYILVMPEVIKLLSAKQYWNTQKMIVPIVVGTFCQYIYTNYCAVETINKKTRYIAAGSALAALLNFVLNLIFLEKFGYYVAAFTTFVGYYVLMLFHSVICRFICKRKDLNYFYNSIVCLVLFFAGCLISMFYEEVLIRYLIVCVLAGIFIWKYGRLFSKLIIDKFR